MGEKKQTGQQRNTDEIRRQIRDILDKTEAQSPEELREAALILEMWAMEIETAHHGNAIDAAFGEYAVAYIRTHFRESVKIGDLAAHIGISRGYLTRLCKDAVGMPPQEYLIECRMEYARQLLSRTVWTVRDIATECGYDDPLTFSKVFRKKTGISPSEFRRKQEDSVEERSEDADIEERIQPSDGAASEQ